MNLLEMTNQVCADTGYLDTDDVTYAKTALRQRDDLLWRMGLWKDSLVQATLTLNPETDEDVADGVVYLPEVIERVVGVRATNNSVEVNPIELYYRIDFDQFTQEGTPLEFAKLSPAWFTWRTAGGATYLALTSAAGDNGTSVQIHWLDAFANRHVTTAAVDDVGSVQLEPETDANGDGLVLVESVFKPTTTAALTFYAEGSPSDPIKTMAASATASPKRQRIRIFPKPTLSTAIKVLGKAAYVPLTFDQQEPKITGSHLALQAFAKHLLLKRGGENGAAADMLTEALGLLEALKKEEMVQEAYNNRITPSYGYGEAYFGPSREGCWI